MIKLKQAVIVEGKYDKITLSNFIDATIITTNGFSVFKDKEKRDLISLLAQKNGLIILTDSDKAGMMIRSYLKKICKAENIKNVYIPQIIGKERRKTVASKEGFLGVEGMSEDIILEAFKRSGVVGIKAKQGKKITKNDLFKYGLSGGNNSSKLREMFCKSFDLPLNMSSSAFLDAVNAVFTYEDFEKAVKLWQSEQGKR